jgi:hypothetical protein
MRCQWHRMNNKNFQSKSENHMQNGDAMQFCLMHGACTVLAGSMTLHARCRRGHWHRTHGACGVIDTACKIGHRIHNRRTIRTAPTAVKGISIKKDMSPNCRTPSLKNRNRIQKGFSPWIRRPGGIDKTWGWKSRDTVPLTLFVFLLLSEKFLRKHRDFYSKDRKSRSSGTNNKWIKIALTCWKKYN